MNELDLNNVLSPFRDKYLLKTNLRLLITGQKEGVTLCSAKMQVAYTY
jgi:hypothetical protein